MRAVVVEQFGGPDVLRVRDVDDPTAEPGHVVVSHDYIGVNYVDAQHRAGRPYPVETPPHRWDRGSRNRGRRG